MSWLTVVLAIVLGVFVTLWLFPEGKAAVGRGFSWFAGVVILSLVLGLVGAILPTVVGFFREFLGQGAVDTVAGVGLLVGLVALLVFTVYLGLRNGWTPGQWRRK